MFEALAWLCLVLAFADLALLAWIDLKTRLLPNTWVLVFACLGFLFHLFRLFEYDQPLSLVTGACMAGGLLLLIREAGNWLYKQDTLGLGDVKLMAAAGLWLGPQDVLLALVIGAAAGLAHGLLAYFSRKPAASEETAPLSTFSLPAGPGFILGIMLTGLAKFTPLAHFAIS